MSKTASLNVAGYIPEHECEEIQNVTLTANGTSYLSEDNCYVDVVFTKDNFSTVTETRECTHTFQQDNTYSSQVCDHITKF